MRLLVFSSETDYDLLHYPGLELIAANSLNQSFYPLSHVFWWIIYWVKLRSFKSNIFLILSRRDKYLQKAGEYNIWNYVVMTTKMRTLVWKNLCAIIIMDKSRQKFTYELWKITQYFPLGHFQISFDTSLFWRFTHFSDDNKKTWSHDFIHCSHWSKCLQYSASFLKQHRRQQYLSIIFSELSREIKETNHSYQNPHSFIRQKKTHFLFTSSLNSEEQYFAKVFMTCLSLETAKLSAFSSIEN